MAGGTIKRYRKGEERTREILAAAADLIYEEGISAVTHRTVANRAGVSDSAPSYFFPSIDDLIVEAFRSIMKTMMDDHEALSVRIEEEDMDQAKAVDEYVKLAIGIAPKYDKVQYEAYLFATRRPALRAEVDRAIAMTFQKRSTLVIASRRDDIGWAAPILTAYADGVGLHRIATPPDGIGANALRDGLIALMNGLPGKGPKARKDAGGSRPRASAGKKKAGRSKSRS